MIPSVGRAPNLCLALAATHSAVAETVLRIVGSSSLVRLGELVMILDLHRQGLSPTAIGRRLGIDRKTVRKYIARGLEPPSYRRVPPRPRSTDAFLPYLRERLAAYPALTAVRLWRELRERGFTGCQRRRESAHRRRGFVGCVAAAGLKGQGPEPVAAMAV